MDERQEGPRKFQAYGYQSCMGCCYHDQGMIKSGLHPIYWHYCNHPSNPPEMMRGNIFEDKGRFIGEGHATPSWCPVLNPPEQKSKDSALLTREEIRIIADAFLAGREGRGFTEEEASKIFEWAESARLAESSLELVLDGRAKLDVKDGEVVFIKKEKKDNA